MNPVGDSHVIVINLFIAEFVAEVSVGCFCASCESTYVIEAFKSVEDHIKDNRFEPDS